MKVKSPANDTNRVDSPERQEKTAAMRPRADPRLKVKTKSNK